MSNTAKFENNQTSEEVAYEDEKKKIEENLGENQKLFFERPTKEMFDYLSDEEKKQVARIVNIKNFNTLKYKERLEDQAFNFLKENLLDNPVVLTKSKLISEGDEKILFNPDDEIELRSIEIDGEKKFQIRNKTQKEKDPYKNKVFTGEIGTVNSIDDIDDFISQLDNRVDLDRLEAQKSPLRRKEYIMLKAISEDNPDSISGILSYKKNSSTEAYVNLLIVDPRYQGSAIGSTLLSELKTRFSKITLSAIEEDHTLPNAEELLDKFYKRNGFVQTNEWSRNVISLDDVTEGCPWKTMDFESQIRAYEKHLPTYIGIDNNTYMTDTFMKNVLAETASNSKTISQLSEDKQEFLSEWGEAYMNSRNLYKEANKLKQNIYLWTHP